jgi:hypothetical protein
MNTTSAEFLERFFAGTEHNVEIRSIHNGGPTQQTFSRDPAVLAAAIRSCLGVKMNVYFGCATRREKDGTAAGVAEITSLWCDLDSKTAPKEDALGKIKEFPVEPSIIIDSGGGFHVYWLLAEPRDPHDPMVRRVLRGLCAALGGDMASAEIARILRVPGTKNFKPQYGEPRDVRIVEASWERYEFSQFEDYAEAEEPDAADEIHDYDRSADQLAAQVDAISDEVLLERINRSRQGPKFRELLSATGSGYFKRAEAVAATLAWWTRANAARMDRIISASELITGNGGRLWWWNQRKYKGNASRKEYVLSRACALVARGAMYDPTERPEVSALVEEFNERFYVVEDYGGKCRVCWEEIDAVMKALRLGSQSFPDFRNRYMHQMIKVGETETNRGGNIIVEPEFRSKSKIWLEHPARRQYREVVYAPAEDLGRNVRNLWRGFTVEPKKGDCGLYLTHLKENICKGDESKFSWLTCWMAWKIRNPGRKSYTAPVFKGAEGVGKNKAADTLAHLFGAHAVTVTKKEHVAGHFNAHLRACSVLVANEAFFAGDRQHEASLKGLITDEFFMIEPKGVDATPARNRLSIIVISNENWVVPAGLTARRFSVFDCGNEHLDDTVYFGNVQRQLDHGGYEALLYHLLHEVDLSKFDERKAIKTGALAEQQSLSLRGVEAVWYECLYRGELPGKLEENFLETSRLLEWARRRNPKWSDITAEQLGLLLGQNPRGTTNGMGFKKNRTELGSGRIRYWKIPSLAKARKKWDELRFKVEWPKGDGDWQHVLVGDEPQTTARGY